MLTCVLPTHLILVWIRRILHCPNCHGSRGAAQTLRRLKASVPVTRSLLHVRDTLEDASFGYFLFSVRSRRLPRACHPPTLSVSNSPMWKTLSSRFLESETLDPSQTKLCCSPFFSLELGVSYRRWVPGGRHDPGPPFSSPGTDKSSSPS